MSTVPTYSGAVSASDLAWWYASRPLTYLYQSTPQTAVATGTWTPVTLQTALLDRDTGQVGATGRYTIGLTLGYYLVSGQVAFSGSGGSVRAAKLVQSIGGTVTDVPGSLVDYPGNGAFCVAIPPVPVHSTGSADWVELQCYHDAGAPIDLAVTGGMASQMLVEFAGT